MPPTSSKSIYAFHHVVFDLDGTLLNSIAACHDAYAHSVAPFGIPKEVAIAHYHATTGLPLRQQYRLLFEQEGVDTKGVTFGRLQSAFDEVFGTRPAPFFDGAISTVSALHQLGTDLFLSSASSDAVVAKRLRDGFIGDVFRLALGSTAIPKGRRHIERFFRSLGVPAHAFAQHSAFVGDGETDMRIARAAGMYAIGIEGTVSATRLRAAGAHRVAPSVRILLADSGPS